jgi:hypothetical protein
LASLEDWTSILRIHERKPLGYKAFEDPPSSHLGGVPARFPFLEDVRLDVERTGRE